MILYVRPPLTAAEGNHWRGTLDEFMLGAFECVTPDQLLAGDYAHEAKDRFVIFHHWLAYQDLPPGVVKTFRGFAGFYHGSVQDTMSPQAYGMGREEFDAYKVREEVADLSPQVKIVFSQYAMGTYRAVFGEASTVRAVSPPIALRQESQRFAGQECRRVVITQRPHMDKLPQLLSYIADATDYEFSWIIPDTAELDASVEAMLLGSRIQVKRVGTRKEYLTELGNHDTYLTTSGYDTCGFGALEAGRLGLVVIVPDTFAYPEYFPAPCRYIPWSIASMKVTLKQHHYQGPGATVRKPREDIVAILGTVR